MLLGCSKDKGLSDGNHNNGIDTTEIKIDGSSRNSESTKSYNYWSKDTDRLTVTSEKGNPPTKEEIIALLMDNLNVITNTVDDSETCSNFQNVNTGKQIRTFSEFISIQLLNLTDPVSHNWIETGCEGPFFDTVDKKLVWRVSIIFHSVDKKKDIFWACGVDFFMQDKDRKPLLKTFRCIDTC
jgi:hypothetical protein